MLFSILILILIGVSLLILSFILSNKFLFSRTLSSPFECGFNPFQSARLPFSLQFFLIAVIFLIFDVEIVMLLPLPLTLNSTLSLNFLLTTISFILILLLGTYYEWSKGALNWLN